MVTVTIDPILFSFDHFMIRWYSLIVAVALGVGLWIATIEAERKGLGKEVIQTIALWVVPAGIIGARLFHVADHWDNVYSLDPIRTLYVWEGGLAIWGGVLGGMAALVIVVWRKGWPLPLLLDTLAPAVVAGQAIGRIACVITGDAMGKPTAGPFGFAYASPNAMVPQLGVYYTPTPVYELLMNVGIFALLWRLRKQNLPDGALFLIYLLLYSSGRFLITFWSSYRSVAFGLNQSQLISLAALVVGLPLLLYVLQRQRASHALS